MDHVKFGGLLAEAFDQPKWELRQPIPGLRHNREEKIILHRFPIKGGLTVTQVYWKNISENNALLSLLKRNSTA